MPNCRDANRTHYTEPTIIQDIFTTGTAHVVAACGGAVRLTFYVDIGAAGTETEHRIMDRVILPREAIPVLVAMLIDAMGDRLDGPSSTREHPALKIAH